MFGSDFHGSVMIILEVTIGCHYIIAIKSELSIYLIFDHVEITSQIIINRVWGNFMNFHSLPAIQKFGIVIVGNILSLNLYPVLREFKAFLHKFTCRQIVKFPILDSDSLFRIIPISPIQTFFQQIMAYWTNYQN